MEHIHILNRIIKREERHLDYIKAEEKIKIGVMGIGRGAGCTFVSTALAYMLSGELKKSIGFVQLDGRYSHDIYDALGMDKRFAMREFVDFYKIASELERIRGVKNIDEYINWAIVLPGTSPKPTQAEALRLVENISCSILICDLGSEIYRNKEHFNTRCELIASMDALICVIDPMPSKLLGAQDELFIAKQYNIKRNNVIWILNKYNDGINFKELYSFLRIKNPQKIPCIDARHFYCAEYNCRIPISMREISDKCSSTFFDTIEKLHKVITDL